MNLPHWRKLSHADLHDILQEAIAEHQRPRQTCPECEGECVEIFSLEKPTGYTGIFKCLTCEHWFDPTMDL